MPEQPLTRSAVEAAAIVLGIKGDIDAVSLETVTAAYREALRAAHPDSNGGLILESESARRIFAVRVARGILVEWIALRPKGDCPLCFGAGHVKMMAFNSRPCPRCT